jgi:hypothetical protein
MLETSKYVASGVKYAVIAAIPRSPQFPGIPSSVRTQETAANNERNIGMSGVSQLKYSLICIE